MRDHYREVLENGWKPDRIEWTHCVVLHEGEWSIKEIIGYDEMFSFRDLETAKRFLKNFKKDLEKIKYLWQ